MHGCHRILEAVRDIRSQVTHFVPRVSWPCALGNCPRINYAKEKCQANDTQHRRQPDSSTMDFNHQGTLTAQDSALESGHRPSNALRMLNLRYFAVGTRSQNLPRVRLI